jgi:hypothetical protein
MAWTLEQTNAFGAADAANGINALAVHVGAKVKLSWILKVAYGMQLQLLDANAVPRQEVDMSGVNFQAHTSFDVLPAVRAIQVLQAYKEVLPVVASVYWPIELPLNLHALSGQMRQVMDDVVRGKCTLLPR